MKTITRLSIFLLLAIITASCFSKKKLAEPAYVITPLSDTVTLRNGSLVYALPMTVFTINVEMERCIEIPGPYAKYADDLLGLKNVITSEEEHWFIKSISMNSHEEADPSEFYVIQSNNLFQTNVLQLKKEGLIVDINPESNFQNVSLPVAKEINVNQFRTFDLGSDEYYQSQNDTAFRRVRVDSAYIRIPYIVEKKKKLTVDQLAERAARRLMDIRDGKIMILTGEANVFPQNEAAINEINRIEKEYTELFVGKSFVETRTFTYQFIPLKELADKPVTLFTFSEATGPENITSKTGTPVILELIPEQKTKDLTIISREQPDPSSLGYDKLYYRIPDVVNLTISMDEETLYNSRKLVYQLGEVMQLPANYILSK